MLATRWREPFVDPDWGFEIKWDGVRVILNADADGVRLFSRAGNDVTRTYPELRDADFGRPLVLDGEVVAFDGSGRPSFEQLQQRMNLMAPSEIAGAAAAVPISFVVFDFLFDAVPMLDEPWRVRRAHLRGLDLPAPMVRSEPIDRDPAAMWDFVGERHLEGIVGKRLESRYRPGARSSDWRKVTAFRQVRTIVGGYTAGEGGRSGSFGALVLGLWTDAGLRYVGAVGSGFSDAGLRAIREALDQMTVAASPFLPSPNLPGRVTWVAPRLAAMVQFKEWTTAGRLRAPSFKGFTDDPVNTLTWEAEGPGAAG